MKMKSAGSHSNFLPIEKYPLSRGGEGSGEVSNVSYKTAGVFLTLTAGAYITCRYIHIYIYSMARLESPFIKDTNYYQALY